MAFESARITGSLWGTSSFAPTASWGQGSMNNFTGSAGIQGDLDINNFPVVPTCILIAKPTTSQNITTSPSSTTNIIFNTRTIIGTGSISFDGTTFTLAGGKSYEIEVNLGVTAYNSAFASAQVNLIGLTGNLNIANIGAGTQNQRGYLIPWGSSNPTFQQNISRWVAKCQPTIDSTGVVQVAAGGTGTMQIVNSNSYLIIRQTSK